MTQTLLLQNYKEALWTRFKDAWLVSIVYFQAPIYFADALLVQTYGTSVEGQ